MTEAPQTHQPAHAPALPAAVSAAHAASMEWAQGEARVLQGQAAAPSAGTAVSGSSPAALPSPPPARASAPVAGLRVSQLDALSLDAELGWMLGASLRRTFKFLGSGGGGGGGGGGWVADHKAECEFVLHSIMFACTVGRDRPTPGMKLQNLQFQNYAAVRPGGNGSVVGGAAQVWRWALSSLGRIGVGRPLSRLASSAVDGVSRSSRLDQLKLLLPLDSPADAAATAASSANAAAAASIPLSHFAPLGGADGGAAGHLLGDAASAASASASVSALGGPSVPPAVLLSSLPSTAPVPLSLLQKSAYFGLSVLLRYAWTKLNHRMTMEGWGGFPEDDWHRKVYKLCRRLEHVYQAINILNFVAFLHNGSYRTLVERLLSIRLVYLRSRLSRQVSFEFMNQQIAWAALSDFMLFLLPLINFARIRDAGLWAAKQIGLVQGAGAASAAGSPGGHASVAAAVAAGCPCCAASPAVQPHVAIPCGCVYCYYCLSGNRLAARVQARGDARAAALADFKCPACQQPITSQAPLQLQLQQTSVAAVPLPL